MSVLIVRDLPDGKAQVLLDGKDITANLVSLSIFIVPGKKKTAVLEYPEPAVIDNPVIEAKFSPEVLSEIEPARRKRGKNATD